MPQVTLVARFKVKDGKAEELIAAIESLVEQVEKEPGTELSALGRSRDDPNLFWTSELYTDDDAFAAHAESTAMRALAPTLEELIAESEVIVGSPVVSTSPRSPDVP